MDRINVTRSSMPSYEEYCAEIRSLWDSRILTNMGPKHLALEEGLKDYLGTPALTLYCNGHLALENAIEGLGLSGEIITTPFTFASTTHAIVSRGCTPVFCDIKDDDFTMDPSLVEELITDKTVAIMPVHVYGNLCDTDVLDRIAKKHNLKLIYDAAHAFGVSKGGISAACFGDVSMFSFHATKVFHSVEGGALCYSDTALQTVFNDLKNFGIHSPEEVEYCGGNAKLNEFSAAMGLCNLRRLDGEIERRRLVYEKYLDLLGGIEGIRLNCPAEGVKANYAYFPVLFDGYKYNRDEVFERLGREGVTARKYFYPLTNSFSCYRGREGFDPGKTPVAKYVADNILCLPMYADLSTENVERICAAIQ